MTSFKTTLLLSLGIAMLLPVSTTMATVIACPEESGTQITMPDVQIGLNRDAGSNVVTFLDGADPTSHHISFTCSSDMKNCSYGPGNITWKNISYTSGGQQGMTDATTGEGWIKTQPNIVTFSLTGQNQTGQFFTVKFDCPITQP